MSHIDPVHLKLRRRACSGLALAVVLLAAGCASTPDGDGASVVQASWYGTGFNGRRTASGERFDMDALTAAHRTLPFGTRVRVRSVDTGREVVVRINDRGPVKRERSIDLSRGAARALGVEHLGVFRVQIWRE